MKKYLLATVIVFSIAIFGTAHASFSELIKWITSPTEISVGVCTRITKNLALNVTDSSSKGEVTKLKKFLVLRNYLPSGPTASTYTIFDEYTVEAVKIFQKDNKIQVTGAVGALTRAKIADISCANANLASVVTSISSSDQVTSEYEEETIPTTKISSLNIGSMYAKFTPSQSSDGQVRNGIVSFTFTLTNPSETDMYISKIPAQALKVSSAGSVGSPPASASIVTNVGAAPSVLQADTGSAPTSGSFVIPAGTSRTFIFTGLLDNSNGVTGRRIFSVKEIRYGFKSDSDFFESISSRLSPLTLVVNLTGVKK